MSREQILSTLRTSLASSGQWLAAEAAKAPHASPPFVLPAADDVVAQLVDELTKLEARAYCVADSEEALETIARLLEERATDRIMAWDFAQLGLPGLDVMLQECGIAVLDPVVRGAVRKQQLHTLEPAQVCISAVDCAIAESGSLAVLHGPGRPRLASLLAPAHIALVRTNQIVRGLGEALALLRERHGATLFDATSNLTFISGPSRTADIEMTLSLGIHGPPQLHVIILPG
jgi:L-lactate dehydrogenase complex protein LldG